MIRAFALVAGLLIGLLLAVLYAGTLGHARQAGLPLPVWTETLDAGSRLIEGRGTLAGASLSWRATGLDGVRLSLIGPDWQVQGQGMPGAGGLSVTDLSGIVPLGVLDAGEGALVIDAGALSLAFDGTLREGRIDGTARGSDPDGAVTLVWQDGGWVLSAR
ncbi:hypothetical protein JI664_13400 [Rhodobacter sp. NTK016B]|uniref:hypothetical protein n=1 Tax=Rhodobacter sp. NTK016B TaxID=2759676 RepID=UPI001A8F8171|nr:hypothetical protein [Rhodobacter sp. NTK016B]MBN8292963.1 hypothetical protein [Rhodobacter sp. NTK016B]